MAQHNHEHHAENLGGRFKLSIALTVTILVVEIIGGIMSNSLALLSDAGHVFADVIALSLSWYGVRQAQRPASSKMTFGYHRVGVLVAIVNAVTIFAIALIVFYEAFQRWGNPPEVNSPVMLAVAVVGLVVNLAVAYWLGHGHKENLNVRSAFWHAWGDALASIGVIIGGVIIYFTGLNIVDPIISVFIGLIIAAAAWQIFREGTKVVLEGVPGLIDVDKMIVALSAVPGVRSVHDIHVWSITPEIHAMSGHVLVNDMPTSESSAIREKMEAILRQQFNIQHTSLQMECQECSENDTFCKIDLHLSEAEIKEAGAKPDEGHKE